LFVTILYLSLQPLTETTKVVEKSKRKNFKLILAIVDILFIFATA